MPGQKSKSRRENESSKDRAAAAPRGWLAPAVILLLLIGLADSLYLGYLYVQVNSPGAGQVDSFCNLNEAFNCVTVATSGYSAFLGLPIALYGIEFYALSILLVLASSVGAWRVRQWDSLIFLASGIGLLPCAALAWISAYKIHSFCIMCILVYSVTLLTFWLMLFASRLRAGELFTAGPRELLRWVGTSRGAVFALVFTALALSQFFWVPGLFGAKAEVHVEGLPVSANSIGPADAPIQVEEFTDFQCPYCGMAHQVMMQMLQQFPGKIRLTHRDYPLDMACNPRVPRPFHPHACIAAIHARCAARQNKFWPYDRLLFKNRNMLNEEALIALARQVGLNIEKLKECARSPVVRQVIVDDIAEGARRGVQGTPAFFVNGEKIVGARPPKFWVEKFTELLKKQ